MAERFVHHSASNTFASSNHKSFGLKQTAAICISAVNKFAGQLERTARARSGNVRLSIDAWFETFGVLKPERRKLEAVVERKY